MGLFKLLTRPDRQQTMLAYRIKFWPWHELSAAGRELVNYRHRVYMTIAQLEDACNSEYTKLTLNRRQWSIVWAYNNTPTEGEWEKHDKQRMICAELRASVAIPEHAVAILSFELPSERLQAAAKGELA